MFLPKPLRRWVAVFRGDVAPSLLFLSALFGFWSGLVPGWQGLHVLFLAIALVVNLPFGLFLLATGIGEAVALAFAPVLYHVGVFAQQSFPAGLRLIASIPIIAMTDTSRYVVAGAVLAGPILGALVGLVLVRSIGTFRRTWLSMDDKSETFRTWRQKKWVRFLDWLLIGKSAGDAREALQRRPKYVRTAGVVAAAVLVAVGGAGLYATQGTMLTDQAERALTAANGAEVNVDSLDLSVWSGRVEAGGVAVTDPQQPSSNRLVVAKLVADVSVWDLLLGRLVIDQVVLSGVAFDQPRATPGRVAEPSRADEQAEPTFEPSRFQLPLADVAKVETYLADAGAAREWFTKLRDWLPAADDDAADQTPAEQPEGFSEYWTFRATVPPSPRVVVRQLVLDDVGVPFEEFGRSRVECVNLSDAPRAAGLPVAIVVESADRPAKLRVTSHYERSGGSAEVEATIDDIDLRKLQGKLSSNNPVVFDGGRASVSISGTVSRETVDLVIRVKVVGMVARSTGGSLFGLDSQAASEGMKALQNLETTLRLVGSTTHPRLVFDQKAFAGALQLALVAAGKAELAKRIGGELGDRLPEGVPDAATLLNDPAGAVGTALQGLTDGSLLKSKSKNKSEAKDETQKDTKKKPLGGLLNRLRQKGGG